MDFNDLLFFLYKSMLVKFIVFVDILELKTLTAKFQLTCIIESILRYAICVGWGGVQIKKENIFFLSREHRN